MRIEILEDDAALGMFLQKGLRLESHDIRWNTLAAMRSGACQLNSPDLIVLGLSPNFPGLELVPKIHEVYSGASILVLLARDGVEDRVNCLNLGADDCLAKPFSFHELTARCRALIRRRSRANDLTLRHGSLALDRIERTVTNHGQPVALTAKEFSLLSYLLQHKSRCCGRSEILSEVFELSASNQTNVVDVYINYLRRKLVSPSGGQLIVTVRGEGYRLSPVQPGSAEQARWERSA